MSLIPTETTKSIAKPTKILLVAPGSVYSTYDTYRYYLDALDKIEDVNVSGFAFHNVIEYHRLGREAMEEKQGIIYGNETTDIIRSVRELLLEIILNKPDVLLFIDGTKIPPALFVNIRMIQKELGRKILLACYMTEAPYINDVLDGYQNYFDVLFFNDLEEVKRRNEDGSYFIEYLPHSFMPLVHYPFPVDEQFRPDVFFCGTLFPERANLLAEVDWTGINAFICGPTGLAYPEDIQIIDRYGVLHKHTLPNKEVSEYYRGAKVCINLNRTFGWDRSLEELSIPKDLAYSVGPRVIEAAACGAFIVSEPRPELQTIFGDSIPTFTNGQELETLIRYYLEHEDERMEKARQSTLAVQSMTYDARARLVVETLQTALSKFGGM